MGFTVTDISAEENKLGGIGCCCIDQSTKSLFRRTCDMKKFLKVRQLANLSVDDDMPR